MTERADEGRRVLRNTATIGAFLASPIHLYLMVRALGADGYGRWWWTFVLLEAAAIVGTLGTDLYVRRELPQLADRPDGAQESIRVVGTAVAIVTVTGVAFALLQIAFAVPIARAQGDHALVPYLVMLAFQPLTWTLSGIFAAALQSRHHLGALAVVRGLVVPGVLAVVLYVSWRGGLAIQATLALMLAASVLALVMVAILYARHFAFGATLRAALRPSHVRPALAYGMRLLAPLVLYTVGGKLDLYVVGSYYDPAYVGFYAAALQLASLIPNIRALFDPILQAQVGALYAGRRAELGRSLRHLARLCAFALAPAFVVVVAVGEPLLGWLVGARVAQLFAPLALLAVGHLVAWIAVGSWIVPMMFAGRLLAAIAAVAGLAKLALLLVLVPRYGAVGAAIATSVGAVIALHGQTWFGARAVGFRPFPASVVLVLVAALLAGAGGRWLYVVLAARTSELAAVAGAGAAAVCAVAIAIAAMLDADDRRELRRLLGRRAEV